MLQGGVFSFVQDSEFVLICEVESVELLGVSCIGVSELFINVGQLHSEHLFDAKAIGTVLRG